MQEKENHRKLVRTLQAFVLALFTVVALHLAVGHRAAMAIQDSMPDCPNLMCLGLASCTYGFGMHCCLSSPPYGHCETEICGIGCAPPGG